MSEVREHGERGSDARERGRDGTGHEDGRMQGETEAGGEGSEGRRAAGRGARLLELYHRVAPLARLRDGRLEQRLEHRADDARVVGIHARLVLLARLVQRRACRDVVLHLGL